MTGVPIVTFAWLVFLTGAAFAGPLTTALDPRHGKELASGLCSNCHLVSGEQTQSNVDVPSFREIGRKEDQTLDAIVARIILPKHPMPTIPLTKNELADIASYILSLREEK